ncbi:hypothetical protein ROJ8625_02195 [Roseivivax jejudonensis]|uniref:Uncharacterized protein n=1 Tax=Roseivivax jejudonensis TaxID=1529041 RepID=A0A1X6Z8V4_9RHOB|nr:DUF4169 family protein [Roseivivax jejudonensis]SLN44074.1 hypothetical protein ROJ8625_02195 [Roseivivax jejudonensis]
MTTPINLNRVRKQKARDAKRVAADANAVKFGRSKAQKRAEEADATRARDHLDGHKKDE